MPQPRPSKSPPPPSLPRRGRHELGLAKIALRRVVVGRAARASGIAERTAPRFDRRREQLSLPPGFSERRRSLG